MSGPTGTDAVPSSARPQAGTGAQVVRTLWALFFIGSSVFNYRVTLPQPEVYRAFSQLTFFGWYRELLLSVALPNARAITATVVLLEFVAGVLMLCRGDAVRIGLIGSLCWVVFLVPALGWYTLLGCLPLIAVPLWLLRFEYSRSVPELALRVLT